MWALRSLKKQISVIATLCITLAWSMEGLYELIYGIPLSKLKIISITILVISTCITFIFNRYWRDIWQRFPMIDRIIFPDLTGTWEGHLVSTWIDPKNGKTLPPIPTKIWIRQGIFSTSTKLRTGESTSHSTRCLLEADNNAGRYRFWYSYDNRPKAEFTYRSAKHDGVAWLELDIDTDTERLVGNYFTERKTTGDIDVMRTHKTIEDLP